MQYSVWFFGDNIIFGRASSATTAWFLVDVVAMFTLPDGAATSENRKNRGQRPIFCKVIKNVACWNLKVLLCIRASER